MKNNKCIGVVIIGILLFSLLFAGCVTPQQLMIPMRDNVRLATDVYVKTQTQPHGAILIRTPYNKNLLLLIGMNWAKNGWPTVIQDMRGRFGSEGNDTVFRNEQTDGPDTLMWIADQTWSNGKVATFGGSALGITQYLTAGANPSQLACQYIQVATPNLYKHAMYPGGEFRKNMVEGWLKGQGSEEILPELWAHENYTMEYWTNVSLDDNWQDVNIPAIHIGGWYDIFTQGTIDGFCGYQYHGGPDAQGKSKLIMGPWTHGGAGGTKQGELTYPANSIDTFSQTLFWKMVDQYTMGIPTDFDATPAVSYYVMGDVDNASAPGNEWRFANGWPLASVERMWYLQPDGSLQTTMPTGTMQFTYTYDPDDPVPTLGGGNLLLPAGPFDQRPVENRSDVLIFTSPVLQQPYEATGAITARLFVSSDCPDTDFTVKLTDVYPDGRSMLIIDGILRMRNRNGTDHWELMVPGTIYQVDVDLWSTSYVWNTGHQIRVDISSSNYPRFLNNPNTADGIYQNNTSVISQNVLYVDSLHPSCLILPEIPINTTTNPHQDWISPLQHYRSTDDSALRLFPKKLHSILERFVDKHPLSQYRSFLMI
ncbi:MAG: CocE/NonD family hydrolase [Candidatus Thermoplasmatota archaeon]|nr:CocE/NonD family hydrolase [Candidatus Thermoplasmatota archaeon]